MPMPVPAAARRASRRRRRSTAASRRRRCSCGRAPSSAGACSTRASTAAASSRSWCSKGSSCSSTASCGASCLARSRARRRSSSRRRGRTSRTRRGSLFQLSFDGITLVEIENGRARHTIRDLSRQNAGTRNPLDRQPDAGEDPTRAMLKNVEDCYRDGDSLRDLFVRPNQVFLTNANRADVFFKAPIDAAGKVYTVFAQEFPLADRQLPAAPADGHRQRPHRIQSRQSRADRRRRRLHQGDRRAGAWRRLRRDEPARQAAAGAAVAAAGRGRRTAGAGGRGDAT